jgi:phosphoribosyl 1,2-cyclic phosphodiesterase
LKVRFWGVRGSIPSPGASTIRYGGDTTCIEMKVGTETIVFDAGSGIRPLGLKLMGEAQGEAIKIHLFITHTHWDHIQGFPFFVPALIPNNHIMIYGADHEAKTLPELFSGQMEREYFPIPIVAMGAELEFIPISEGTLEIGDIEVSSMFVNHPSMAFAYRVNYNGHSVVFGGDHEPYNNMLSYSKIAYQVDGKQLDIEENGKEKFSKLLDKKLALFCQDADLLIFDTAYTLDLYPQREGWGHSYPEYAVQIANMSGIKRLALTHHDPTDTDDKVDAKVEHTRQFIKASKLDIECFAAQAGLELNIE